MHLDVKQKQKQKTAMAWVLENHKDKVQNPRTLLP